MYFYPNERIALLIDGMSLESALAALGEDIDYGRLRAFFARKGRLVSAGFYVSFSDDAEYEAARAKLEWLEENGFAIIARRASTSDLDPGRRRMRKSVSVDLAVDALQLAGNVDHLVLFSGDGQLRRLVEALQEEGKRVTVVSTIRTRHPIASDELRRQADQFLDLVNLAALIGGTVDEE